MMEGPLGAESEEKREPVSDIDTALVDSLKVLDPDGRLEKPTYAVQQKSPLFNHLVGALLEEQRNIEAERLGGLGVDGHLKFGRQLDGKLHRLCATENAIDVGC